MLKDEIDPEKLEEQREFWAKIAKENGWYFEPFHIQVWVCPDGTIQDSVGHTAMKVHTEDLIIPFLMENSDD